MTDLFELNLDESPIPQAMDVYYEQIEALVSSTTDQKIALTNTLINFPMGKETRLFNKYVARAFADRAISSGSPVATGGKFIGPANVNDRFSSQYERLVNKAIAKINFNLSTSDLNKIEASERMVEGFSDDLNKLINEVLEDWEKHKREHLEGLPDLEVELRQIAWFQNHRLGRRISVITKKIDRELTKQELVIANLGSDEFSEIYRVYNAIRNSQVALPKNPYLEEERNLDEISMGNPLIVGTNPTWADVGVDVDPIIDYRKFLEATSDRGFGIERTTTSHSTHERKWSASAKIRYGWFFKAKLNASSHTKLKESLIDTKSIGFDFDNIGEIWIRRGDWYSSDIFDLPIIQEILAANKRLASNLKYSVSSLLICRGFNLTLKFTRKENYDFFKKTSYSGSARILNIFPAGSGSVNETTTKVESDDREKSITFRDDPSIVRLLGFKVDEMHSLVNDDEILADAGIFNDEDGKRQYLTEHFGLPDGFDFKS